MVAIFDHPDPAGLRLAKGDERGKHISLQNNFAQLGISKSLTENRGGVAREKFETAERRRIVTLKETVVKAVQIRIPVGWLLTLHTELFVVVLTQTDKAGIECFAVADNAFELV